MGESMLIRWQSTIVDQRGNVVPGAVLTVRRESDQSIAAVYRDAAGADPYPTGTVTADENGYAHFYATPGLYRLTSLVPAIDWRDVNLQSPNVSIGGPVYASTEDGLAATTDGDYFSVPSDDAGGYLDLYRNNDGVADKVNTYPDKAAVDALDTLVINRTKHYPLRSATRAGVTSSEMAPWNGLLLAVLVWGAKPGKLYGIRYQKNNSAAGGSYPYGWVLTEHAEADYATTDAGMVLLHNYTQEAPNIDRDGGIQTLVIPCANDPTVVFSITVDAAQLPAEGASIDSNSDNTRPGWSWIVDPSCYVRPPVISDDALTINSGKAYPLKSANRGGVVSVANGEMSSLVLDAAVFRADRTKHYRIAYQQNGASLGGTNTYDWIIEEYDAETYETSPSRVIIASYDDATYGPQEQIDRNGGIQTIYIEPKLRPGLQIMITCDASKLPPEGTPVNAYTADNVAGWSWIIDPARVYPPQTSDTPALPWSYDGIKWSYTSDDGGTLVMIWRSGSWLFRLAFGPKGPNSIPDIRSVMRAPLGDPDTATWTTIVDNSTGGDWTGPYVVGAVSDGDGDTSKQYTGGNHGRDGSTGGGNSGENVSFVVMADGTPVATGAEGVSSGIKIVATNEVMAYNTRATDPPRYVLRETCRYDIYPGFVGLKKHAQALEDILVYQDNGPQTFTVGYQSGTFIYYGKSNARAAFTSTTNSGAKSSNPDVWAVVFQDDDNGQLAAWMDRSFGIGDGQHVKSSWPYIRGGGSGNTKFYHAAVVSDDGVPLAAGESYEWRGGWAWQQATTVAAGFDSTLTFNREDNRVLAQATDDGLTVEV